jgi:hypothetical protein
MSNMLDLIRRRRASAARDAAAAAGPITDELRAMALLGLIEHVRSFPGDAAARERLCKLVDSVSREQPSFRSWVEQQLAEHPRSMVMSSSRALCRSTSSTDHSVKNVTVS